MAAGSGQAPPTPSGDLAPPRSGLGSEGLVPAARPPGAQPPPYRDRPAAPGAQGRKFAAPGRAGPPRGGKAPKDRDLGSEFVQPSWRPPGIRPPRGVGLGGRSQEGAAGGSGGRGGTSARCRPGPDRLQKLRGPAGEGLTALRRASPGFPRQRQRRQQRLPLSSVDLPPAPSPSLGQGVGSAAPGAGALAARRVVPPPRVLGDSSRRRLVPGSPAEGAGS